MSTFGKGRAFKKVLEGNWMNLVSITFSMTAVEKIFHAHMLDKCRK